MKACLLSKLSDLANIWVLNIILNIPMVGLKISNLKHYCSSGESKSVDPIAVEKGLID